MLIVLGSFGSRRPGDGPKRDFFMSSHSECRGSRDHFDCRHVFLSNIQESSTFWSCQRSCHCAFTCRALAKIRACTPGNDPIFKALFLHFIETIVLVINAVLMLLPVRACHRRPRSGRKSPQVLISGTCLSVKPSYYRCRQSQQLPAPNTINRAQHSCL
jgi:hypothetical protein